MAGNRIGSNEHPPGVREKRATLHTAILQGVAVLFYSTPFVLTHYIPLKLGKYFSSYALTARWVHFLFVENGDLCSASGMSGRSIAATHRSEIWFASKFQKTE